jgi:hypothetical protein
MRVRDNTKQMLEYSSKRLDCKFWEYDIYHGFWSWTDQNSLFLVNVAIEVQQ